MNLRLRSTQIQLKQNIDDNKGVREGGIMLRFCKRDFESVGGHRLQRNAAKVMLTVSSVNRFVDPSYHLRNLLGWCI
jgi:hypothetical protein